MNMQDSSTKVSSEPALPGAFHLEGFKILSGKLVSLAGQENGGMGRLSDDYRNQVRCADAWDSTPTP